MKRVISISKRSQLLCAILISLILNPSTSVLAQEKAPTANSNSLDSPKEVYQLKEVVVEAKGKSELPLSSPLPDLSGVQINSGKKTTVADLEALPPIASNNYRQAFSQLPGLLTSEVGNESFTSFSYRGLGDPHESFNINLLRNGIPIAADMYGYPANYYQPPIDSVSSIEFIRGGASLMYGPQVGGALNFVTRKPDPSAPATMYSKQVFGERNFFSTYNELSGTKDNVSYLGFFHRRQSDGFRDANADYGVNNGNFLFTVDASPKAKWSFEIDAYDADHGEAGGLTHESGEGLANYDQNRYQSTVLFDRLRIERYSGAIGVEYEVDSDTTIIAKAFGGYYDRFSRRQSAGTANPFGGIYNGTTNTIADQEFSTMGLDARVAHSWKALGEEQNLAAGFLIYGVNSPFTQQQGVTPWADSGTLQRDIDRTTRTGAIFAENRFNFGRLRITPGARLEMIDVGVNENVATTPELGLRREDDFTAVFLPGIGVAYELSAETELYANTTTGYKPKAYADLVPLNSGDTISSELDPAHSVMYETGVRGTPLSWMRFDSSVFLATFKDQFGRVGSNIQNVGDSRSYGLDLMTEFAAVKAYDSIAGSRISDYVGNLNLFWNAQFLNAEFTDGPVDGRTPQYAPDYVMRGGLRYDYEQRYKLAFLGTFVDDHYADDANTANRYIPSYRVWDLTGEAELIPARLSLVAGVNNVFDERYYARIRSNGIDPALPRNVYGGVVLKF
jgi:Fe(3+) dicitrate transport protein